MLEQSMKAHLCVITCDKCGEPMKEGQNILILGEGMITESNEVSGLLSFQGSGIRYACHLDCWDGVEVDY